MKWRKFPSEPQLMSNIFTKYCEVALAKKIRHGAKIAAFLAIYKAKEMRRRKHNETFSFKKIHC